MRRVVIDRRRLTEVPLLVPGHEEPLDPQPVIRLLDALNLPDGFAFLIDDDGSMGSVASVNRYLTEAWSQGAYSLRALANSQIYDLWRALRFVRLRRATQEATEHGFTVEDWIAGHGVPKLDLSETTREDLVALRDARLAEVEGDTWNNELSTLGVYFDWAKQTGVIDRDPIPRWGQKRRNTLASRTRNDRQPRFLTEQQLRLFLEKGLRADGDPNPPNNRERDYAFGLVLATMGLRREEAALLLDCEIPTSPTMPTSGVWPFRIVGKGARPRTVFATTELVTAVGLYRTVERSHVVQAAQPTLRRLIREDRLVICDAIERASDGTPVLRIGRRKVPAARLNDAERAAAVIVSDRGEIEPLALFVGRNGNPVGLRRWNDVFADARVRVAGLNSNARPPAHLTVTPHVFRHTYAVRMLSALMRVGRQRSEDPYVLLANPVLTVMELLGHADVSTTQRYLYAAERYTDELPAALRQVSAATFEDLSEGGASR